MVEPATFRKPDRYKASSYRSYNGKMPSCYDTAIWSRGAASIDRAIIEKLGASICSPRILDVGCATGRLLDHLAEAGATHLAGTDLAPNILEGRGEETRAERSSGRSAQIPATIRSLSSFTKIASHRPSAMRVAAELNS